MIRSENGIWVEQIELTDRQVDQLAGLEALTQEHAARNDMGILLAQVFPGMREIRVAFIPHELTYQVLEILNPAGYKRAVKDGDVESRMQFSLPGTEGDK